MALDFEVVDLPEADPPAEGTQAPDFVRPLVNDEYWEDVSLSELTANGPLLLVFYTMDGGGSAAYVWDRIRNRAWEQTHDLTVVGLSISTPYEHKTFIDERDLPYRLFSDPQNGVAEEYGVCHDPDGMAGLTQPRPAVFLFDETRTVQYAWAAQEWPEMFDYDEVGAEIDTLCGD